MEKLNFQDAAFLNLDAPRHPYHVAGLIILKPPEGATRGYLRRLAADCRRLNELWPIFGKKLSHPDDPSKSGWVKENDYHPEHHVLHYALPEGATMSDLMELMSRAHERQLDRFRPLWEIHLVEGLPKGRFALYCKVHHALVDGAGAMRMMDALFSTSPEETIDFRRAARVAAAQSEQHSLLWRLRDTGRTLARQYRALPELGALLAHMGQGALRGAEDVMRLPFTAPRTIFNSEIDPSRRIITCDLPFSRVRAMAKQSGGSINDVLLSICGGALRRYLREVDALPRKSLLAGMPVAVKSAGQVEGNQLSFILSPYFTNERDALKRLRRVIRTTRSAKKELAQVSNTAAQDYTNLILVPTMLLTMSGNATAVTPPINAIFSNVAGSREKLYLEGSEVEAMYPLSVVTAGMGLNITVLSYASKLCFAITSCPTEQPHIERLGKYLRESYRELGAALAQEPT